MNTEICAPPGVTEPIVEFDNMKCSVTGGYVSHGTAAPGLANTYLFGDVCSGGIFAAVLQATTGVWKSVELGFEPIKISSFG